MRSATALVLALVGVGASASDARAYLDGTRFDAPAIEGGGGGRSFTGAPADGYACSVCHRGGGSAPITVEGLPSEGWEPGVSYELVLTLPATTRSSGAALEIADDAGRGRGAMVVLPDAELEASDRCRDGAIATTLVTSDDRLVARTTVCGAARARVRWTAPPSPESGLRFFASAVAGNDSGDPSGDGASSIALPLRARGAPEVEGGMLGQRCSAVAPGSARTGAPLAALLALVGAAAVARRTRSSRARAAQGR